MNIFVLDEKVEKCAEYHCDKHVIKMILESAQMMSAVVRLQGHDITKMLIISLLIWLKLCRHQIYLILV
mgnify:CR=1 FL=1